MGGESGGIDRIDRRVREAIQVKKSQVPKTKECQHLWGISQMARQTFE
jgi:hypothetical protein